MVKLAVRDARTQRRVGRQRVGTGSERENTVVDIPHRAQLRFQHDALAAVVRLLQENTHITDEGRKVRRLLPAPVQQGIVTHGLLMVAARQFHVFGVQNHVQAVLGALLVQMQKVTQTQGLFAVLVAVSIGDAAPGRAERAALFGKAILFQPVLYLVPRHGDGSFVGKLQVLRLYLHPARLDGLHLPGQMLKVDHHTGAQHAGHLRVQDAGGQQVQDELALLGHNGMAGIVAALIARNDIGIFGQQVNDAALALIAPVDSSNSGQHKLHLLSFSFLFPVRGVYYTRVQRICKKYPVYSSNMFFTLQRALAAPEKALAIPARRAMIQEEHKAASAAGRAGSPTGKRGRTHVCGLGIL